jgi:hypothetical protein
MAFGKNVPPAGNRDFNPNRDLFGPGGKGGGKSGPKRPFYRYFNPPPNVELEMIFHDAAIPQKVINSDGNEETVVLEFLRGMQHWHNNAKKMAICSAGPYYYQTEKAIQLCSGCEAFYAGMAKGPDGKIRPQGPVNRSEVFWLSTTILSTFFLVPTDRMNPTTGLPYTQPLVKGHPDLKSRYSREELAKLERVENQKMIFSLNKTSFGLFYGDVRNPGGSIDEQLRRNCLSCGKSGDSLFTTGDEGEEVCTECGAPNSRAHLHNSVVKLKQVPSGISPMTQKPVFAWVFVGCRPIPADLSPELLTPIPLLEACAPATPEQQQAIFGKPPKLTAQGATGVVQVDESMDEIPFLAPCPSSPASRMQSGCVRIRPSMC